MLGVEVFIRPLGVQGQSVPHHPGAGFVAFNYWTSDNFGTKQFYVYSNYGYVNSFDSTHNSERPEYYGVCTYPQYLGLFLIYQAASQDGVNKIKQKKKSYSLQGATNLTELMVRFLPNVLCQLIPLAQLKTGEN